MGFNNCAILNGGLPAWKAAGHTTGKGEDFIRYKKGSFVARVVKKKFCDASRVLEAINEESTMFDLPVEQNVYLVPTIRLVLDVDELLNVDLKCVLVAETKKQWRCKSILLAIALLKRQCITTCVLFLL